MDIINNCDELLAYLANEEFFNGSHKYSCGGYLEFQGDLCEVGGIGGGCEGIFLMSSKYPMYLFEITPEYYCEDCSACFTLSVFRGPSIHFDQTLGIRLPNYVKDELIATIQGYN